MRNYLPIRKVVMTAVGGGLTWASLRAGANFGSDAINQASTVIVGLAFAYAEKDPRVVKDLEQAGAVIGKVEAVLHSADQTPAAPSTPEA